MWSLLCFLSSIKWPGWWVISLVFRDGQLPDFWKYQIVCVGVSQHFHQLFEYQDCFSSLQIVFRQIWSLIQTRDCTCGSCLSYICWGFSCWCWGCFLIMWVSNVLEFLKILFGVMGQRNHLPSSLWLLSMWVCSKLESLKLLGQMEQSATDSPIPCPCWLSTCFLMLHRCFS